MRILTGVYGFDGLGFGADFGRRDGVSAGKNAEFFFQHGKPLVKTGKFFEDGVGKLLVEVVVAFAVAADDSAGNPDDGAVGRNVFQNDAAGADLAAFADDDGTPW